MGPNGKWNKALPSWDPRHLMKSDLHNENELDIIGIAQYERKEQKITQENPIQNLKYDEMIIDNMLIRHDNT